MCCIVSDASPGPLNLIEHGRNGIVFRTDSIVDLADAISQVARDETMRCRLANAAFQRVQEFSVERVAEVWAPVLFDGIDKVDRLGKAAAQ